MHLAAFLCTNRPFATRPAFEVLGVQDSTLVLEGKGSVSHDVWAHRAKSHAAQLPPCVSSVLSAGSANRVIRLKSAPSFPFSPCKRAYLRSLPAPPPYALLCHAMPLFR